MAYESMSGRAEAGFSLADLEYELPQQRIAQQPLSRRDASRMLMLGRTRGEIRDGAIADLPGALEPGDLLVLNDTKVIPAKFTAQRTTGGRIGGLFVREDAPGNWQVMLQGSRRLRVGETLAMISGEKPSGVQITLREDAGGGSWRVAVDPTSPAEQILDRIGRAPLPPYIHRDRTTDAADADDRTRYQTVYARRPGAVAAPTAGCHLTQRLLDQLRDRGVETTYVTLHVGVGTFKPIHVADVTQHAMHAESYEITQGACDAVNRCRKRGGRVVAVGTTSVRVLESLASAWDEVGQVTPMSGMTNIFIYPPYRFRVVDGLLTNFHLPRSTLLALVMAFAGVECVRRTYRHAVELEYRFYSYGDAMLVI